MSKYNKEEIKKRFLAGKTMAQIGKEMKKSGGMIRYIIHSIMTKEEIRKVVRQHLTERQEINRFNSKCGFCGKKLDSLYTIKKFCDRVCFQKYVKAHLTPPERRRLLSKQRYLRLKRKREFIKKQRLQDKLPQRLYGYKVKVID